MSQRRVLTFREVRTGRPRRGPVELPRLPERADLPDWVGPRVSLTWRGHRLDFALAGAMAHALGVTRDSLLRLEARGVVPLAYFHAPGRWPGNGKARLYPVGQVLATAQWIDEQGLRGKRLSYRADLVRGELQRIADAELVAATGSTA